MVGYGLRATSKTHQDILETAMKDIVIIKDALSSKHPIKKLKTAKNLIKAYREHLRRREVEFTRQWGSDSLHSRVCCHVAIASDVSTIVHISMIVDPVLHAATVFH